MALPWLTRPGLAGGIDKDGSRAAELLGLGFGSVEFGSVTVNPVAGSNPGIAALVARLARQDRSAASRTAIGIGLSLSPEAVADSLADEWQAGLGAAWQVADYLSLNLSAKANQLYLATSHRAHLMAALRAVAACRERLVRLNCRRVALAVKMPLGEAAGLWATLAGCGFEQLTVVLPDHRERYAALAQLASGSGGPVVVAVGGVRCAGDMVAARAAGAAAVQVHRLFVEQGAACLSLLDQSLMVR